MSNNEYCVHCCFQYDKKPGAITGGVGGAVATESKGERATEVTA